MDCDGRFWAAFEGFLSPVTGFGAIDISSEGGLVVWGRAASCCVSSSYPLPERQHANIVSKRRSIKVWGDASRGQKKPRPTSSRTAGYL